MTFASHQPACDDECCEPAIPDDIAEFVQSYKRRKILPSSSTSATTTASSSDTTQNFYDNIDALSATAATSAAQSRRILLSSAHSVAVNELTLPEYNPACHSQKPILEYAKGRDRIILVTTSSTICAIGRGVINTASEESSRAQLDWASEGEASEKNSVAPHRVAARFYPGATGDAAMGPIGFVFKEAAVAVAKIVIIKRTGKGGAGAADALLGLLQNLEEEGAERNLSSDQLATAVKCVADLQTV